MTITIASPRIVLFVVGSIAAAGCSKQQPAGTEVPGGTRAAPIETADTADAGDEAASEVAQVSLPPRAVAPESVLEDPAAIEHFVRGHDAYSRRDYATAISELEAAYAIEPNPLLLYARAQAERFSGNCKTALELYQRFLDADPAEEHRRLTETNVVHCEA